MFKQLYHNHSSFMNESGGAAPPRKNRHFVAAGKFYPADKDQLLNHLEKLFDLADSLTTKAPLALIVPHAGYVYSGLVAATAYKQIDRNRKFKHVFVIGSSHTMYFKGAAVCTLGNFITPLGKVKVDSLATDLSQRHPILSDFVDPHLKEHSLEVQLPFLQYWLKEQFSIVPISLGGQKLDGFRQLAEILQPYFTPENLFIISTDFSHYPKYKDAVYSDQQIADAIQSNSPDRFIEVKASMENSGFKNLNTAICGWTSVFTLLSMTQHQKHMEYTKLLYQNSGDSKYGDKDQVVGYYSLAVLPKE